jgi:hypothetical protein
MDGLISWYAQYHKLLNYREALKYMPYFFTYLNSSNIKIGWKNVNTAETYERYSRFMGHIVSKMRIHLWCRFSSVCIPSTVQVLRENSQTYNISIQFFMVNQSKRFPWIPKKSLVHRSNFGFISKIAMKMTSGPRPFKTTLIDGSIRTLSLIHQKFFRLLLRRILSFSE